MPTKVVQLSGGVGGARLARGFLGLDDVNLTVIVNVGDDTVVHGLSVSPDVDTVCYTLAGIEGPMGWGRAEETFHFNDELATYGLDNTFQLGDRDLALKVARTRHLAGGGSLSSFTEYVCRALGVDASIIPVTDDPLRTKVELGDGWTTFVDYFVTRRHQDPLISVAFDGAQDAQPAPGVIGAIAGADIVVIGPSNPILSIWPIIAVPGIEETLANRDDIVAVSPLISGQAVKGPARQVLEAEGFTPDTAGVVASYQGLVSRIYVDVNDTVALKDTQVVGTDIMIGTLEASKRLAREIVGG